MALNHFGFIFTGRGLDPETHRSVIAQDDFRAVMVGVSSADQGVAVATEMVADGVELIELCGGFGALHNPGCSWGLNPPASRSARAM